MRGWRWRGDVALLGVANGERLIIGWEWNERILEVPELHENENIEMRQEPGIKIRLSFYKRN